MNTDIRARCPGPIVASNSILTAMLALALCLTPFGVSADAPPDTPSNEELYQMIQRLEDEAAKAKREAELARQELADRQIPAAVSAGITEARDPAYFARLENTFMSYGQEGGASDAAGNGADFGNDYTPRLEFGYVGSQGMGIRGRYWSFDDTDSSDSAFNDKVKVDTDSIDLELFQQWQWTEKTEVEASIGVRVLDFEQTATDFGNNRIVDSDFSGYGATLGLQTKRKWGIGKVYGRSRLSVLLGEQDLQVTEAGTSTKVDAEDNPISQLELGFGYEVARELRWGSVNANLGYEWQYWTNTAPANDTFGGIGDGDNLEDVSFRGFVLGVGAEF
ncbi:Lpg1974 family pore-forming outer membrane protein [Sulfuriflexus sp.]|uniref:Lpg1974 family pore-forming outer membrane protein n=1 Tax=Sulfuriflexus sp. TaxID=2015443 RepID=UPI0028CF0BC7|nr:Lpg1974 family pore-forming outer membrane protein [Sulfuriflexus sp.]MDT8403247.1 Lpg1974 family pore-forming outer membrane protein [Sulfuriflexus sp.]